MLEDGRVQVNGVVVKRAKEPVPDAAKLIVGDAPKPPAPAKPTLQPMRLVYEDDSILVVDKPAGLLTSTVPREKRPTALAIIRQYLAKSAPEAKLGLVHRLDRDASGILVFSKNDEALRSLKSQFFKHSVRREYLAITHSTPTPAADRIDTRLVELPDGSVRQSRQFGKGERAITDYETIKRGKGLAAVRVTLLTGRKHQIRAQLAQRGVPIVGDSMYGQKKDEAPRLMLAAVVLGFDHPKTGNPVVFSWPIPKQFPLMGGERLPVTPTAATPV